MAENPIERMTPGQILTDASVSEFIKAMGLSIAEAQLALDANSLSLVEEYTKSRPGLDGKSLLQLGLSPPFYHYQHADLSVNLQITMKVGNTEAFGIGANLNFGFGQGGTQAAASAREAQITVRSLPANATVDGRRIDGTGEGLEAAAETIARGLRTPTGPFERAIVASRPGAVQLALEPAGAQNPIKTDRAIAFYPSAASSTGVIRIIDTPTAGQSETFTLASGKAATVASAANKLLYARAVVTAINGLGGFRARLLRDPVGSTLPVGGGTLGLALFDTGSAAIKPDADAELTRVARMLREGGQAVNVIGFTDRMQPDAPNVALGQRRADAVADTLIAKGVPAAQIRSRRSEGEQPWTPDTQDQVRNQQFRRAEVILADSTDLLIIVDSDGTQLQATPTPDKTGGDPAGNGFIIVRQFAARPVDGTTVKLGATQTSVALSGTAVTADGNNFAASSPEAFAFNLTRDVNAGSATHGLRATRSGSVVNFANASDAVTIDLVTVSANEIRLEAGGGASVTRPLASLTPGPAASRDRPAVNVAVGLTVDYRTSRQFEQSVNGNSSIQARIVSVPAPVEFLDEIKQYLAREPTPAPPAGPNP